MELFANFVRVLLQNIFLRGEHGHIHLQIHSGCLLPLDNLQQLVDLYSQTSQVTRTRVYLNLSIHISRYNLAAFSPLSGLIVHLHKQGLDLADQGSPYPPPPPPFNSCGLQQATTWVTTLIFHCTPPGRSCPPPPPPIKVASKPPLSTESCNEDDR